jgi:flagella basal body P-ring formation protein FlgA
MSLQASGGNCDALPVWRCSCDGISLLDSLQIATTPIHAMSSLYPLLMTIAAAANPGGAATVTTQSLDAVREAAATYVRAQLPQSHGTYFVTPGKLDPRLRLAPCGAPLEVTTPANALGAPRVTAAVRCAGPQTWTVYIPMTIETETAVLVLRHGAARGAQLSAADVEVQTRRVPGLASRYVASVTSLEGRRLKRSLPAGNVLTPEVLVQDVVVRRGQRVILLASSDTFEIRAQGTALSDGRSAERIRVQNDSSHKIVEGVVQENGVIRITP